MKSTRYFTGVGEPLNLLVLAENKDGTLELGYKDPADETKTILKVGKCQISADKTPGTCEAPGGETPVVEKKTNK